MSESYTRSLSDFILDLPDLEIAAIWEDIESTPLDTTKTLWKKKLQKIARDNIFSSRFALMRILCSRAHDLPISNPADTELPAIVDDFELCFGGKTYRFHDISREHAETLTPQEHEDYIACLMEIASRQADSDPTEDLHIISRAWYDVEGANAVAKSHLPEAVSSNAKLLKRAMSGIVKENKAAYKNHLTREEAFHLGHSLGFTLEEAQWFFLRVFDVEDGFRFNLSYDLIEAYGFLTNASWQLVQKLHEEYEERSVGIEKKESSDRHDEWTRNISNTLPGKVEEWVRYPETQNEKFIAWLLERAPDLDVPSRTAQRIYRNLASFAYDLITGSQYAPDDSDFCDCIRDVFKEKQESGSTQRLLYEDGVISPARCKMAADKLLLENKVQCASIQSDNTKAWHVLTQLSDGALSTAGGIVNTSRTRVADILSGSIQPEKGDFLYLFWFVSNFIWSVSDSATDKAWSYRLMDFMEVGRELLDEAMVPTFYPPHILEQSMLLSIACGGRTEEDDPCVVYEYMLYSTVKPKAAKMKPKKKK